MKRVSLWFVQWLVCFNVDSLLACGILGRAITQELRDPRLGTQPGIIPFVGNFFRRLLGNDLNGSSYPGGYGQYGAYPGAVQGNYPAYNQAPLGSPYYPNQQVGMNPQMQPVVNPGQPYYPNMAQQPLVTGTAYQPTMMNAQPQPLVNSVVPPVQG